MRLHVLVFQVSNKQTSPLVLFKNAVDQGVNITPLPCDLSQPPLASSIVRRRRANPTPVKV